MRPAGHVQVVELAGPGMIESQIGLHVLYLGSTDLAAKLGTCNFNRPGRLAPTVVTPGGEGLLGQDTAKGAVCSGPVQKAFSGL